MSRRTFIGKLLLFFLPFAAVFALPLAVTIRAWEIAPVSMVAAHHQRASEDAVYGPAYTNPDKGYKLASVALRQPPIIAIGTSRVMQIRSDFFVGGEATFYNAGGVVTRIFDHRVLLQKLESLRTRRLIVGLDQWAFNERWADFNPDPGVEREYDGDYSTLDVIQRSLHVYSDLRSQKFSIGQIFGARDAFGINAMSRGNGFRRDGSYRYADILRDPEHAEDFEFKDTLSRVRTGTRRFETGSATSERALAELEVVASRWKKAGFEVVAFSPPFAPTVIEAARAGQGHGYMFEVGSRIASVLERHGIPFIDFTNCENVGCTDQDFVDGTHGGPALYAKMMRELARSAPWLAEALDRASLDVRLAQHRTTWDLPRR